MSFGSEGSKKRLRARRSSALTMAMAERPCSDMELERTVSSRRRYWAEWASKANVVSKCER